MKPIGAAEREPVLDVLRGFAVLGILLVNMELIRGSGWIEFLEGGAARDSGSWDRIAGFAIGWLASGKFLSSLALLFGVGAGLMATRALRAAESPRPLLARRYLCLVAFGLAHMLIFPGDILFLYGMTGLALLPFVKLGAAAALSWAVVLFVAYSALDFSFLMSTAQAAETLREIVATNAWQAIYVQPLQFAGLPWILAMFLFGYAVARAGVVSNLAAHRTLLTRGAWIGLGLGLPANFALGFGGPLPGWSPFAPDQPAWLTMWQSIGLTFGEPVLAVGYLCALSLICLRYGAIERLAAVGRMTLTAYLLESLLGLAIVRGLGLYDRLSTSAAVMIVGTIWVLLLIACPLWLRRFRMGPMEWLWRALTYR